MDQDLGSGPTRHSGNSGDGLRGRNSPGSAGKSLSALLHDERNRQRYGHGAQHLDGHRKESPGRAFSGYRVPEHKVRNPLTQGASGRNGRLKDRGMTDFKQYTVLIVDDEEALRETMVFDFKRKGFTVFDAENG